MVAMSLDGYIAGPNGEADWITMDPEIDFAALFAQFDTIIVGRKTFAGLAAAGRVSMPGMSTIVFSRTLQPADHPEVAIVAEGQWEVLTNLKTSPGKDIWLFGGGGLFASLAADGLVDTVEVAVIPILLGTGVPLLPGSVSRIKMTLTGHKIYKTGIVSLEYAIG